MKKIRLFLLNGIILTSTSLLLRTIGVSFNVYISGKIGAEAVGVYQLLMSVYMFAITLSTSGINFACMRIISEELACGLNENIAVSGKKCLFFSLLLGCFAGILLSCFAPFISRAWLHHKISCMPLYVISISLPFVSMSSCLNGYFSAVRRVVKNASIQIIEQFFKVILITYFLNQFMPSGVDFACLSLVLGNTISEMLSFLLNFLLYSFDKKKYGKKINAKCHVGKKILKIACPIAFTSYLKSGLSTLKQLLIPTRLEKSGISCEKALAEYGTIGGMVMPLILFPCTFINSFSNLLVPEFSYYQARGENRKMNFAVCRIFKYTLLFSFAIVGIFWCFSQELNTILYPNTNISHYLKLLSPLIVFMYFDNIVDGILKGLDKQISVMGINIIDLVSSISLLYFLLPSYGIAGYIIVIFISEILNCILSIRKLLKIITIQIDYFVWIIKPLLSLIFTNFCMHLFPLHFDNTVFSLVLEIGIFLLVYFMLLTFFRCITKEDIQF